MKVTILVSRLIPGGAERATVNMANHWARRGWEPTILTTSQRGRPLPYALDAGVEHRDIGWRREPRDEEMSPDAVRAITSQLDMHDPVWDPLFGDVVLLTLLRHAIAETKPHAVISMIDLMNVRMLAATEGLKLRRFVSERCDPWRTDLRHYEPLRRRLYRRADGVIAQTSDAARYFERFEAKCFAIPNVVVAPPAGERRSHSKKTLIVVARLVAFKQINTIIRAFAQIADRHPEWTLEIWGEGPQREFLESVIARVGHADRIHLRGETRDVYPLLREADLFAMASTTEGFPNALCEAMACGVPAVVVDCGAGVREIVRHGVDGVLVPSREISDFAAALDRVMGDDAGRARLAARAPEVVERFSADKVMQRWEEVIA